MATSRFLRPPGFLDFPGEVRNMIYDLVFQGSRIKYDDMARDAPPLQLDQYVNRTTPNLLATCKTVRKEAFPILARNTTLEIPVVFGRKDPLRRFPAALLTNIKTVIVHLSTFVHFNRKLLPALEKITVVKEGEGVSPLADVFHGMFCKHCGGQNLLMREVFGDFEDWEWMKEQIKYLSMEEGWKLEFSVRWECAYPMHNIGFLEVVYDVLEQVLTANIDIQGQVYDVTTSERCGVVLEVLDDIAADMVFVDPE